MVFGKVRHFHRGILVMFTGLEWHRYGEWTASQLSEVTRVCVADPAPYGGHKVFTPGKYASAQRRLIIVKTHR